MVCSLALTLEDSEAERILGLGELCGLHQNIVISLVKMVSFAFYRILENGFRSQIFPSTRDARSTTSDETPDELLATHAHTHTVNIPHRI